MNERESGGYQAGRFEAMSRTRDAFTGNVREKINIRSQQLAVDKNDSHQVNTFNPEQFKAKTEVISTHQAQSRAEIQSAWDTYGQAEQNHLQTEFQLQVDAQLPWEIDQKLGKMGKEQVLSAIQARKAQAEKATNANTEAIAQEQALTQQEIQLEADKLLAMAPESLLAGSLAALAIWVINRLPNKIYRRAPIALVLGLLLPMISACSTINSTPTTEIPHFAGPTATATKDTSTLEPTPQAAATTEKEHLDAASTAIAETKQASRADAFLESYLTGQSVDVSQLSPAEYKEFSVKLAEKKNAERGINPVLYKDEAYVHPDHYMMMDYDGHADMAETITMYLAIDGKDSEGNLQIIDEDGKIITIANSANIDWNMRVTDPNDPRIDLANTGEAIEKYGGLTIPQRMVGSVHKDKSLAPMILLDKNPGVIYFYGDMGPRKLSTYQFLKVETDQNGNPILARKFLIFPAMGKIYTFNEGSTNTIYSESLNSLLIDSVYYLLIRENQEDLYTENLFANPNDYTGIIDGNEAPAVLTGELENNTDMILLGTNVLIKPAN